MFVHRVVLVEKRDRVYNAEFPFQAVQAHPLRHCPSPPFLLDGLFRAALREACWRFGHVRIAHQVDGRPPTPALLRVIHERYGTRRP